MLRLFYCKLLRLHPPAFRERFADEMLDIFDQAGGVRRPLCFLGDAFVSLFRQWVLRPEFHQTRPAVAASGDVLMFQSMPEYRLRPSTLIQGAVITVLVLGVAGWTAGKGARLTRWSIGAEYPRPSVLGVDRASIAEGAASTTVSVPVAPPDPLQAVAAAYFRIIRVLDRLDADKDLALSPWEMFTAPAVLRRLDIDHDGRLSAEECGFSLGEGGSLAGAELARARRAYMLAHPVLAALDENHDGEISGEEIARSERSLKSLDHNGDGSLTPAEVLPDEESLQVAAILAGLDLNGDGQITPVERRQPGAHGAEELLDAADRNHDGIVNRAELAAELRLRAERRKELLRARSSAGFR